MEALERPAVFITSTGRTGTQFFAQVLEKMIQPCQALHEPGTPWPTKPGKCLREAKLFGFYAMSLGQLTPRHCMYKLSTERWAGRISDQEAREAIYHMRRPLLEKLPQGLYVESSGHIFALQDLLDQVFHQARFIFVVRDPRTWIRSAFNTLEYYLYGPLDERPLHMSIKAPDRPADPYARLWPQMDKFAKYCWFYNALHSYVLPQMEGRANFRLYRFEDLFDTSKRDALFQDMLAFSTDVQAPFDLRWQFDPQLLEQKVHSNAGKDKLPRWQDWTPQQARTLQEHCGQWMQRFGYGQEEQWQAKIGV